MKKTLLPFLYLLIISIHSFSQADNYNCYLKNITQIDARNLDFEIWIESTGTNSEKLQHYAGGLNFNYWGMANGGTITGAVIPGSPNVTLPPVQQTPNWNINASSNQIRLLSLVVTPSSDAVEIPPPPGFSLGTFRMTNTVDFFPGSTPDFVWSFNIGTSTTTETKVLFYPNGSPTGIDVTIPAQHFVIGNPALAIIDLTSAVQSVKFFPNPGKDNIYISGEKTKTIEKLNVYNTTGNKLSLKYSFSFNNEYIDLDISSLSTGIYFLEIISGTDRIIKKFVKE